MRSGTRVTCGSTVASPSCCACAFRSSTTAPTASTSLRGGARRGCPPRQDRHPDRVVGDRASVQRRAGGAPLHRGAHPRRRHRPRRGVPALHDALAEHFSPEEILEIVAVVVNMNVWTRISLPRARCRARVELPPLRNPPPGACGPFPRSARDDYRYDRVVVGGWPARPVVIPKAIREIADGLCPRRRCAAGGCYAASADSSSSHACSHRRQASAQTRQCSW
jgi:hypothetical protein